jgi:hypothetical protein
MKIWLATALGLFLTAGSASAFVQTKFASEDSAQSHCPGGMVVWLTLPGNFYVRKGDPRYGATQRGAYICEHDAITAGNRLAH